MKKIIILYFFGALLLSGCMRDEFDTTRVEEGIAACVSLRMLLPDMTGAVSAGGSTGNTRGALGSGSDTRTIPSDVENRLDNLRVLIFNGSGEVVTNRKYTAQPDGPSLSSLQIDTIHSALWQTVRTIWTVGWLPLPLTTLSVNSW